MATHSQPHMLPSLPLPFSRQLPELLLEAGGGSWEVSAATAGCAHVTGSAPSPFPAGKEEPPLQAGDPTNKLHLETQDLRPPHTHASILPFSLRGCSCQPCSHKALPGLPSFSEQSTIGTGCLERNKGGARERWDCQKMKSSHQSRGQLFHGVSELVVKVVVLEY